MADPVLPPSRFGAGYTIGGAPSAAPVATAQPARTAAPDRHAAAVGRATDGGAVSQPAVRVNPLAGASFVLVLLLGPFVAPLTIPMGLFARSQISRSGQGGAALAKAALALSCIYLAAALVVLVLAFVVRPSGAGSP